MICRPTAAHGMHGTPQQAGREEAVVEPLIGGEHRQRACGLGGVPEGLEADRARSTGTSRGPGTTRAAPRAPPNARERHAASHQAAALVPLVSRRAPRAASAAGCPRPRSEWEMSTASRRSRVSGCLALMTQKLQVRRYHGGCASKKRHAFGLRAEGSAARPERSARGRLSKEYWLFTRASNAASPAALHAPFRLELAKALDVDRAPGALGLARREAHAEARRRPGCGARRRSSRGRAPRRAPGDRSGRRPSPGSSSSGRRARSPWRDSARARPGTRPGPRSPGRDGFTAHLRAAAARGRDSSRERASREWAAQRGAALAQALAVLLEQLMRLLHEAHVGREAPPRRAGRRVGSCVGRALADESEANQHAQRVRVGRQQRVSAREQQDLLGARLADAREAPQRPLRAGRAAAGPPRVEVAAELVGGDAGALAQLGGERGLEDALRGDLLEGLASADRIAFGLVPTVLRSSSKASRRRGGGAR